MKTNAMRLLDSLNISYEVLSYAWDEKHGDAVSVAHLVGMEANRVCKTIVMHNEKRACFVFCVPGPYEINMKKARIITGSNSMSLVDQNELRSLTGYIRGGVSPLAMVRTFPVFIEETVQLYASVCVSAGVRGLQLLLAPQDLVFAAKAQWADLV